jgi:hypothetical protein
VSGIRLWVGEGRKPEWRERNGRYELFTAVVLMLIYDMSMSILMSMSISMLLTFAAGFD